MQQWEWATAPGDASDRSGRSKAQAVARRAQKTRQAAAPERHNKQQRRAASSEQRGRAGLSLRGNESETAQRQCGHVHMTRQHERAYRNRDTDSQTRPVVNHSPHNRLLKALCNFGL